MKKKMKKKERKWKEENFDEKSQFKKQIKENPYKIMILIIHMNVWKFQ
jgi:hypothetical protein